MAGGNGGIGGRRRVGPVLWAVALVLTVGTAAFQRFTGPTYPVRGAFVAGGERYEYSLTRSGRTGEEARIALPDPGSGVIGFVYYRRYPTGDPFRMSAMRREGGELVGLLPPQPPAGKLEYYVVLSSRDGATRIPEGPGEHVIMRFKDHVPLGVLLPHVLFMFLAVLVGLRAGLGAVFSPSGTRRLAWLTLGLMTVGGLVLGPIVQYFAFGEFWTGIPFGWDVTDNKTLLMWLVWAVACGIPGLEATPPKRPARAVVVVATVLMIAVYLVPHSLRGSEYDYSAERPGAAAEMVVP